MPQKKKRKLSRSQIAAIVTAVVAIAVAVAILIVNVFIPVKYLSSYFVSVTENEAGQMRVSFIDVGNGDCTLVELPDGEILLIDGGDGTYKHNLKILKELNRRGIDKIDFLVCSSVQNDACGGLSEILKYKTVDKIFAPYCPLISVSVGYKSFFEELKSQGKESDYCEYGKGVFEEGYSFCFLSPDSHLLEGGEYDNLLKNPDTTTIKDSSAVIWLEYSGVSFLFLGYTTGNVQDKLIESFDRTGLEMSGHNIDITKCDVVKMSDHGSTDGAFAPFLDLIKPSAAIISVGDNGRGCPTLAALANAQNAVGESGIYRTDELGCITVTVKGGNYEIIKEKK